MKKLVRTYVFAAIILASCHKDKTDYAIQVAGVYRWHHTHVANTPFLDTTYYYPDTTFAVHVVDRKRVKIGSEILEYYRSDDRQIQFVLQGDAGDSKSLTYYKATRNLIFSISDHINAAGNTQTVYESF